MNKNTEDLKNIIGHLHLVNVYRTLSPVIAKSTFLSSTYTDVLDPMLGHKTSPNEFKLKSYQVSFPTMIV